MKPAIYPRLTRREFALQFAGLTLSLDDRAAAQVTVDFPIIVTLSRALKNAYMLAVSPDGKRLCMYVTKYPTESFALITRRWVHKDVPRYDDSLIVINLNDGTVVFRAEMPQKVVAASFFADGEQLFAETLSFIRDGRVLHQQTMIDLRIGTQSDRLADLDLNTAFEFHAVHDNLLLVQSFDQKLNRTVSLLEAEWPSFASKLHAPYATREREKPARDFGKVFSPDRRFVVYAFDHVIVCRKTDDLRVIWSRQIEAAYLGAWRLSVSPNAKFVAAAMTDSGFSDSEKLYYVAIYSGADGSELKRFQVSGTDGVAISPDGKLLATAHVVYENKAAVPTVFVRDVATGAIIATLRHEPVMSNPFLNASFGPHGVEFSSDGKFLITSSQDIKVWAISF